MRANPRWSADAPFPQCLLPSLRRSPVAGRALLLLSLSSRHSGARPADSKLPCWNFYKPRVPETVRRARREPVCFQRIRWCAHGANRRRPALQSQAHHRGSSSGPFPENVTGPRVLWEENGAELSQKTRRPHRAPRRRHAACALTSSWASCHPAAMRTLRSVPFRVGPRQTAPQQTRRVCARRGYPRAASSSQNASHSRGGLGLPMADAPAYLGPQASGEMQASPRRPPLAVS